MEWIGGSQGVKGRGGNKLDLDNSEIIPTRFGVLRRKLKRACGE